MDVLFETPEFRALELEAASVPRLASFYADNPEYHVTVAGAPAGPNAAQEDFDARPPEAWAYTRKWVLLFEDDEGAAVGMADLLQDLFEPGIWHVGLFIVATRWHGSGRAQAMFGTLERWMVGQGARWLRLGVVDGNARGSAFWRRVGFAEVRTRENYEVGARRHRLQVMVKPLGEPDWAWYRKAVPRDRPGAP